MRLWNDEQLFAVFSVGPCVFSRVVVFVLFVSLFPNWELQKWSFKALEGLTANCNIAFPSFLGIIGYLTFPFGMQLDDHNWYFSSLAQHKAVDGKKKALPGQIPFGSLRFFLSLIGRVYSSQMRNRVYTCCRQSILNHRQKAKRSIISWLREKSALLFQCISFQFKNYFYGNKNT